MNRNRKKNNCIAQIDLQQNSPAGSSRPTDANLKGTGVDNQQMTHIYIYIHDIEMATKTLDMVVSGLSRPGSQLPQSEP